MAVKPPASARQARNRWGARAASPEGLHATATARGMMLSCAVAIQGQEYCGGVAVSLCWGFWRLPRPAKRPRRVGAHLHAFTARPTRHKDDPHPRREAYIQALWPIHGDVERSAVRVSLGKILQDQ